MPRLKILIALITEDNDYQQEQAVVAQATAQKLDVEVQIVYGNNDGVTQSLQIVRAIQAPPEQRPHAVIVEAVGTPMPQVAHAAAAANIGWVMLNRNVDYLGSLRAMTGAPSFCLATDNEAVGHVQGMQFNSLIPTGKSLLYVTGPTTSDATRLRSNGMLAAKRSNIDVKTLRGDWTETTARKVVQSWLKLSTSKDHSIGLIGCQNDAMAVGTRKAIDEIANTQERSALLKVPFTGCDGIVSKGQKYVQEGLLRATIIAPPLTGLALKMLTQAMRAHQQPAEQTLVQPMSYPPIAELHP